MFQELFQVMGIEDSSEETKGPALTECTVKAWRQAVNNNKYTVQYLREGRC